MTDGLAHRAVLSLALDKNTGDVWAGTMGGLSRISQGRIDTFTQLNSGLSNDVVYGVSVESENVWVATAAGACRLDLHTHQWSLYNETKHPHERDLGYAVSATPTKVYYAFGVAACSNTIRRPADGTNMTILTERTKWCSSKIRA